MLKTEKITYSAWPDCFRISNGLVDLVVTSAVGPRIIRFGFIGEANEFKEYPYQFAKTDGTGWRIFGGHRLWHAPEAIGRSCLPDNDPVQVEIHRTFVRVVQRTEVATGIRKEMDILLTPDSTHVRVTHRLYNCGLWNVELAPWALTVMEVGGTAVLPLPRRGTHLENLQPTSTLTLWAYTDLADPRWTWGEQYILLRQDTTRPKPQKIGAMVPAGWLAYANRDHLFIKKAGYQSGRNYPDFGASVELYTNDEMLEAETLGPLTCLAPGTAVEHIEHWYLYRDVPTPEDDAAVNQHILPIVETRG
jgi:hypothetical protein